MALIVIEGVDRTGKSELAMSLAADYENAQVLHFGPPKKNALREYLEPLLDYDPRVDNIICDRLHIGEVVWPKYFNREPRMTRAERGVIEVFLASRGGLLVHATRDIAGLRKAFEEADPPEPLPVDQVFPAMQDFEAAVAESAMPAIKYRHDRRDTLIPEIGKRAAITSIIARPGCSENVL